MSSLLLHCNELLDETGSYSLVWLFRVHSLSIYSIECNLKRFHGACYSICRVINCTYQYLVADNLPLEANYLQVYHMMTHTVYI